VGLYTLGCKVSQYETAAVGEEFERRGFLLCDFNTVCDVYVINTCTVTAESDRKSRQIIRRAIKNNPDAIVLVMGCYTQRAPDEVAKITGVSAVVGTENKLSLVAIAEDILEKRKRGETVEVRVCTTDVTKASFESMTVARAPRTRAYVKIEDGCESKCTYCAISGARGRVRSKPREDVIAEVEALYKNGTREIVLTGIETASYGRDFDREYGLAELLRELDARHSCERIRLGSLAPELINHNFVMKVKDLEILAPHFHLSLQSGSDSVLRGMKRRYNSEKAMRVIDDIRENIPRATFTTDLMVGFPGESEENFFETADFVRRAEFLDAHVFAYSRREGTPAAYYDGQIPECEKHRRSEILIGIKNEVRDKLLSKIISKGAHLSVVAETRGEDGFYTAHSAEYIEVKFFSENLNLTGEVLDVIPVSQKDGIVYCELANEYK
jgi:threonylcarbamoyladenosine tRNA methylthiotransferase MtaB